MAMTEEQFDREKRYQASMNMFRTMLKNGLITEEQYAIIDTKMLEKYRPLLGTCGRCGANYRCQTHKRVDGTVVRSWYCSSPTAVGCSKVGIREDTLKALIADVMGLPEFDEELFNQHLAYATVPADNQIIFHFRDGHEASRTFVQKRQMPRQTEERKKHMSEVMKAKWRERHAEND